MKYFVIIFLFAFNFNLLADETEDTLKLDVTKKPEPLEKTEFKFPDVDDREMSNGIKVFVVNNSEQPAIDIRLSLPAGSLTDKGLKGMPELTAQMLVRATSKRNSNQIEMTLDSIGASLKTGSGQDNVYFYLRGLKKDQDLLIDMLADMLRTPVLDKNEFRELKDDYAAELRRRRQNPEYLGKKMIYNVLYGKEHPYSSLVDPAYIEEIKYDDVIKYYKDYFKPNNVIVTVAGDVNIDEIMPYFEEYFGKWEKGKVHGRKLNPRKPKPLGVYFIKIPGAEESNVYIANSAVPFSDRDFEKLTLIQYLLGGNRVSVVENELRDKLGVSGASQSILTSDKEGNIVAFGAEVPARHAVKALEIIRSEMKDLVNSVPAESKLAPVKKYHKSEYQLALEDPFVVTSLIEKFAVRQMEFNLLKAYTERIRKLSGYQLRAAASNYMNPKNSYIVVVGDPEKVSGLEEFGRVFYYDSNLNPSAMGEKISIDAEELLEKYREAIGGEDVIDTVNTLIKRGNAEYSGQYEGMMIKEITHYKAPNKMHRKIDFGGRIQEDWFDGNNAWSRLSGSVIEMEGSEYEYIKREAAMFPVTRLLENGFQCNVAGKHKGEIILNAVSPSGEEISYFFESENYLLKKKETVQNVRGNTILITENYQDYKHFGDLYLPSVIINENPKFTLEYDMTYEINPEIGDEVFTPDSE